MTATDPYITHAARPPFCCCCCCCCCCAFCLQAFKLLITDKKQLDGMQQSALEVAAKRAIGAGHKNATTESGPWLLTLDYPTYLAVVTFAHDRELRKKLYTSYRRVAADGVTNNDDVIKQILKGRQELAQLLNFTSYAEQAFLGKVS
jgi:oligopeptidase A